MEVAGRYSSNDTYLKTHKNVKNYQILVNKILYYT